MVAGLALLVVVAASVTMERAASALGTRFAIPEIIVGGLVLAAVTSLPNAVAAVYLAGRGRGAATFSTALNSNTLNVALGLVLPAAVVGLGRPSGQATLITSWYIGLTAATLAFAYRDRGIRRYTGILIIAAYVVFAGCVLITAHGTAWTAADRGQRGRRCRMRYPAGYRPPPGFRGFRGGRWLPSATTPSGMRTRPGPARPRRGEATAR